MANRRETLAILAVFAALMILIIFFTQGFGTGLGLPTTLGDDLITLLPGLVLTVFCVFAAATQKGPLSAGACAVLGVGLSILLSELYTMGVVTDAMLNTATLAQYQLILVVVGFIFGVVKYAVR